VPAGPSVSVPHVDIPLAAATTNNLGVLLIANYRVGGETFSFVTIPSEVLMGLSALPIGGVRGTERSEGDRLLAHGSEPQIRLTILNQPSIRSEPDSDQTPAGEQSPVSVPRTSVPLFTDAARQSSSALSILLKNLTSNLEEVWRNALDNVFTNGQQGTLSEWLERLPTFSPPAAHESETNAPEDSSESQDDFDAARRNSSSLDLSETGAQPWVYAGLLLGMGAVLGVDVKKRHDLVPAGSPWEANGDKR
jgi:hypothetical protein